MQEKKKASRMPPIQNRELGKETIDWQWKAQFKLLIQITKELSGPKNMITQVIQLTQHAIAVYILIYKWQDI